MNYLIVVAHPDDEVLGAGGTMYQLSKRGDNVYVCIMSGKAEARNFRPTTEDLFDDTDKALTILSVKKTYKADFPNIKFNNVDHLDLVQFIEKCIIDSNADVVLTHHPGDTNNDHLHTSLACQAAIRLFQRKPEIKPIKELLFMEILSATEWSVNKALNSFNPNFFIEIHKDGIDNKINALDQYRDVMRPYPHPRSKEALEGLALYRGGQSGLDYAEAFETVFRRELI